MWKNKIKKAKQAEPESPTKESNEQNDNNEILLNMNTITEPRNESGLIHDEDGQVNNINNGNNSNGSGSTKRPRNEDENNQNNVEENQIHENNNNNNGNNHNHHHHQQQQQQQQSHLHSNNGSNLHHTILHSDHTTLSPSHHDSSDDQLSKRVRTLENTDLNDSYSSSVSGQYDSSIHDETMQLHYQYESRNSKSSKRDQNWDSQFEALLAYANKHKHCNVRTGYTINSEDDKPHVNLYAWLALQRRHKKQNKLRPDREKKLQSLVDAGMLSWSGSESNSRLEDEEEYIHVLPPPPPPSWESHFIEVLIYAEMYGHANVPLGYLVVVDKRKDIDLGLWLEDQRKQHNRKVHEQSSYSMNPNFAKLQILAEEGRFSWQSPRILPSFSPQILDAKWSVRYEAMRNYIAMDEHRHVCLGDNIKANLVVPVPELLTTATISSAASSTPQVEVFDLGLWVLAQRKCYLAGILSERRKSLLQLLVDANQFTWQSKEELTRLTAENAKRVKEEEALWNAWYNALVWQGNHVGHCNLESNGTITLPDGSEAELGKWLHIQRVLIKRGKLSVERVKKIKKLFDSGKLDINRWAHIFTMSYPVHIYDDNVIATTTTTTATIPTMPTIPTISGTSNLSSSSSAVPSSLSSVGNTPHH